MGWSWRPGDLGWNKRVGYSGDHPVTATGGESARGSAGLLALDPQALHMALYLPQHLALCEGLVPLPKVARSTQLDFIKIENVCSEKSQENEMTMTEW